MSEIPSYFIYGFDAWAAISDKLPDEPGVYSVWANEKLLYVGTSKRIRKRVRWHNKWPLFYKHGATHVLWAIVSDPTARFPMERFLIKRHKPLLSKEKAPPPK